MCIIGHSITRSHPDYARLARNYCELGASDAKLAKFFGVSPVTLALWIADIPEFADAVREGRLTADADVAESLHQRAVGWHETVERVLWRRDKPVAVTYTKAASAPCRRGHHLAGEPSSAELEPAAGEEGRCLGAVGAGPGSGDG